MPHISEAAPLQIERFYTGWFSYRNPLIVPIHVFGRRIIELYDAFSDGFDMECLNRLTLARRFGYTLITPTLINGNVLYFTNFKPSSFPGQVFQLIDTTTVVAWVNWQQPAPSIFAPLVTKETPGLTNFAQVGAYLYLAQEQVAVKWDAPGGAQGITNWGIDIYDQRFNQGPNQATTVTNLAQPGSQAVAWTIHGTEGTVDLTRMNPNLGTVLSQWLEFTGFGFTLTDPNTGSQMDPRQNDVRGFLVQIQGISTAGADIGFNVRMVRNGSLFGTARPVTLPANVPTIALGRPNDTWDGNWKLNDLLQPNFGVAIQAVNNGNQAATFSLTGVALTAYIGHAPDLALSSTITGVTTQTGFKYVYCYGNANSGHISSPTPPSFALAGVAPGHLPTGNVTADGLITVTLSTIDISVEPSADTQVTDIHIFRTTDGGGLPFFELPMSPIPNTPTSTAVIHFIDTGVQDFELEENSIAPDPHFNDPPPGGALDPVWFGGRLWLHRGHQLWFASGPDISQGNGQEAWFPGFVFAIPNGQIVRKFPTPNGLLLVTHDEINITRGSNLQSFTVNDYMRDIGMRTWTAGDTDGTNVYLYTSDRQFLMISPNGLTSISANIANRINAVDPTLAYVAQHRFTATENMIFVGDGSTIIYPFNQELQAWALPQRPVQGATALGNVELTPGVFQFWRAHPATGVSVPSSLISFRDLNSWVDEGVPYPCQVIFGPIPVADFLTLAQLRDIVLTTATTNTDKFVSVLANEILPTVSQQFELLAISSTEPPELSATPSLSYSANRYTWKSAPIPELVNFCFLRFDFTAAPNPDEIFSWTLGGTQTTGGSALGQPGQLPPIQGR